MKTFTAGFMFCGLGAGARGFVQARGGGARFKSVGGVDNDPEACADFEKLTGSKATVADIKTMTAEELRAAWGDTAPDIVFASPPCKGFSGLLSKKAASAPKYRALNELVIQGLALALHTWPEPPALIVLENVPRITSRGAWLLFEVKQLLRRAGYILHDGHHECGELGGLAQKRRRYLLVARLPRRVPGFVYQPPKKRVRACGEVLEPLPMPNDPKAGPMHSLPKINWLTWVRLALIPAGGDWRHLPGGPRFKKRDYHNGNQKVQRWEEPTGAVTGSRAHGSVNVADPRFKHSMRVTRWEKPVGTITGAHAPSNGAAAVADPRVGKHNMRVMPWDEPAGTVTGAPSPTCHTGAAAVADPRIGYGDKANPGRHRNKMRVGEWEKPTGTVTAAPQPSSGGLSVADPRILPLSPGQGNFKGRPGYMRVQPWEEPAPAVTGTTSVSGGHGTAAIADPRLQTKAVNDGGARFNHALKVNGWEEPVRAITGGAHAVADPRVGVKDNPGRHWNQMRVGKWDEPAGTVIGSTRPGSGALSVADPRAPLEAITADVAAASIGEADAGELVAAVREQVLQKNYPIIVSDDGTWHRPLTTLELAILQGLPARLKGKPLVLAGAAMGRWRERIGNAVPVGAAKAIATVMLTALARAGTQDVQGDVGVWVQSYSEGSLQLQAEA